MATSPEQVKQEQQAYQEAYNEDAAAPVAQTDDAAFGLDPEPFATGPDDSDIPNAEEATETPAEAAAEVTGGEEPVQENWEQKYKTLQGKYNAEISSGAPAAAADPNEAGESPAEETIESPIAEVGEQVAEKVAGMSPDEALKALAADFGEDFTAMISSIIDAKVAAATGETNESVQEIIADIVDSKAKAHFEKISTAHPDFMDVEKSPEFSSWVSTMPEAEQGDAVRVIKEGTADEINSLLSAFKGATEPAQSTQAQDNGADAAEGVRSSGMRLPSQPGASTDYSAAWDEFKD